AYKGVLREALEEGYVNSSSSLEVLQQMRQELGISDQEHLIALTELGVEDPDLLNPNQQRNRENQIRLQSFRNRIRGMLTSKRRRSAKGLGRELLKVVKKEKSIQEVLHKDGQVMRSLSREYGITWEEEEQILAGLNQEANLLRRGNMLLSQLQDLAERYQSLKIQNSKFKIQKHLGASLSLLQATIEQKQRVMAKGVLDILETLEQETEATRMALALGSLAPQILSDFFQDRTARWEQSLNPMMISRLQQQIQGRVESLPEMADDVIVGHLEALLSEPDSLTKAVSLYLLSQFHPQRGQEQAQQLLNSHLAINPLVKETAQKILQPETQADMSTLEKLLYLASSDLFNGLKAEHLINLAYQAQVKIYSESEVIVERGHLCQELLLLIQGKVQRRVNHNDKETLIETIAPVQ
ncbi:MAG: cyclic nucleotide-binding protein, partial [Microcystaceae cyanobacterium]